MVQNLLDKAIAYVSPKTAIRRMQARSALALAGGYAGARIDRASLASWRTSAGSPATDVIADLPMLRQRSADLERNAPVAAGVINTTALHTVGTGLSCNPQIDGAFLGLTDEARDAWQTDTRRRFRTWCDSVDCDLARRQNFFGLQDLTLRGTMVRGDLFALTPMVPRGIGGRKKLAVQLLEADYCSNPQREADTETRTEGIDHDAETGEAVAYHFTNRHPGDSVAELTWTRREARSPSGRRNVLHLYRVIRPGLRRGIPILAPVMEPLKQLARYTESELAAAVTSSLFSVFIRMDPKAFSELFDETDRKVLLDSSVANASKWSGEIEPGQAVNLLPGEEPIEVNPARPNEQFDPFVTSCIRQIGMAIGIPYEVLIMHYQSSYSAARGALLMAWKYFIGWRDWLSTYFCQPVYELWLADEVANRRIAAPGFFADEIRRAAWCKAQWVGDGPGSIDPTKDVEAAEKRCALGTSTLQAESILHDGIDWESKHPQSVREAEARRKAGLSVPGEVPKPAAPAGGAPKPKPADD